MRFRPTTPLNISMGQYRKHAPADQILLWKWKSFSTLREPFWMSRHNINTYSSRPIDVALFCDGIVGVLALKSHRDCPSEYALETCPAALRRPTPSLSRPLHLGSLFASEIDRFGTAPTTLPSLHAGLKAPRYTRSIKKTMLDRSLSMSRH